MKNRRRGRVSLVAWALVSALLFAGVASADCTIHVPPPAASTLAFEPQADGAAQDESPSDDVCLASHTLSTLECTAGDAAWLAPALLARLAVTPSYIGSAVLIALPTRALLFPLPEPVFRRFPLLLI